LSSGSKREELYEALLNGLTEVEATQTPILWIASYGAKKLGPSEEEIRPLTGVEEPDTYIQWGVGTLVLTVHNSFRWQWTHSS